MATRAKKKPTRKKRGAKLGQHFLTAPWAASMLADSVRITSDIPVLEIGPGTGNLTKELLRRGARVIAVEKDPLLVDTLNVRFSREMAEGKLTVISGDIRTISISSLGIENAPYILAANIPYYITGEILRLFLSHKNPPIRMAVLIQKEVAERIARSVKESILSLSVKAYGEPRYIKTVPRGCFAPPPNVDSAILLIDAISREKVTDCEKYFFTLIKKAFSGKRKMVGGTLKSLVPTETLRACGIAPQARAENIPLEKWFCVARSLTH